VMFWCFNTVGHFHQINGSLNRFSLEIFADVGQDMSLWVYITHVHVCVYMALLPNPSSP